MRKKTLTNQTKQNLFLFYQAALTQQNKTQIKKLRHEFLDVTMDTSFGKHRNSNSSVKQQRTSHNPQVSRVNNNAHSSVDRRIAMRADRLTEQHSDLAHCKCFKSCIMDRQTNPHIEM